MKKRDLYFMLSIVFVTVFLLAIIWEFGLEEWTFGLFSKEYEQESSREHWRYVITVSAFVFFALWYPALAGRRLILKQQQAEREIKYMNQVLLQEKKKLEQANAAKTEFLSRMNHELFTPMNIIMGFSQILEMRLHKPSLQEELSDARKIIQASEQLLGLFNEVLNISKIEAGEYTVKLEPVFIGEALAEAVNTAEVLLERNKVILNNSVPPNSGIRIFTDRAALKQILFNLLSNAILHNYKHGAVTLNYQQPAAGKIRIQFSDTGPGIALQDRERIFEPFERLGKGGNTPGAGIGLTVTRKLVEICGGKIGLESKPEKGSTFWVEFPEYTKRN